VPDRLSLEGDGPVGRLTLNRPEKRNALSAAQLADLVGAAEWFDARPEVKVVVVAGAGRAFCAGFDLGELPSGVDNAAWVREKADLGRLMADRIAGMRALTVAAISGACAGAGVVLAAACDIRLAAADATFSIPEIGLGLPLGWGAIPRLVREIGPAMTKELVLTCRPFRAQEARDLRFVNRVVAPEDLDDAAAALASELAEHSAFTLATTKRQVQAAAETMVGTTGATLDAELLVAGVQDAESREVGRRRFGQREHRPEATLEPRPVQDGS
jgi:enoyl-CoA hydratase/carnithine racemase